jgi:hypothetical protein
MVISNLENHPNIILPNTNFVISLKYNHFYYFRFNYNHFIILDLRIGIYTFFLDMFLLENIQIKRHSTINLVFMVLGFGRLI